MSSRPEPLAPAPSAMTLLAAAVIVHDEPAERILLIRRALGAAFAPGSWDLPSGKSDPGEPVTTTAVRELHEETGLVVDPGDLRLTHLVHGALGAQAPNGFLTVVFAATAWSGTPANREPAKHDRVLWAPTADLPGPFVPSTGLVLDAYLSAAPPSVVLRGWE